MHVISADMLSGLSEIELLAARIARADVRSRGPYKNSNVLPIQNRQIWSTESSVYLPTQASSWYSSARFALPDSHERMPDRMRL